MTQTSTETRKTQITLRQMIAVALCACVLAVISQISIPMPTGVPLTLQTFAVALIGCVLGVKSGMLAIVVYLLIGAVGVPVFSGFGAGFHKLVGATGGFLFGFIPMAALCALGQRKGIIGKIIWGALGLTICHVLGVTQFSLVSGNGFIAAFAMVSAPYLIKDILSVALAYLVSRPILNRLPESFTE